jgi:3-dehydroquinate synthase
LPTRLEELAGHSFSSHALIGHMARDKKARSGGLTFILARGIGEAFVADHVDLDLLNGFLISEGTAE